MAETIQGNGLWHITLAERDLVQKAGLDPKDFEQDFGFFRYKGRRVIMSHIRGEHLVVSMDGQEDADLSQLMDSFSKVVEYKPFCKYNLLPEGRSTTLPTYEWDKVNPNSRYEELSERSDITDLMRL